MKTYNYNNHIVDREYESDTIKLDIENSHNNKVQIIYSRTAVGKSALSQKIVEKCSKNTRYTIFVRTNPENNTLNKSEWLYIDKIFESINKYFETHSSSKGLDFNSYICKSDDQYLKKLIYENIAEQLFLSNSKFNLIKIPVYYYLKKRLKISEFNSYKLLENNTLSSRMFKVRYIQYIVTNVNLLLIIDNIQNIDEMSMKYILDWLNMSKVMKHYFIFEYTLSKKNSFLNLLHLAEQIQCTGTLVSYSKLEKLSPEYAIDVIEQHFPDKPNDLDFNINLLNQYNEDPDGNLRHLIDYTVEYTPENISILNPTLNSLSKLSSVAKYIFASLIFCNGELAKSILYEICQQLSVNPSSIKKATDELKEKRLLKLRDDNLLLEHASLKDEWNNGSQFFAEFEQLAYINLENYFHTVLANSNKKADKDYAWLTLLQMYAIKTPNKIEALLPELSNGLIEQISPTSTWKYLNLLVDSTKFDIILFEKIYYEILVMCFQMELYNEGYYCVTLMEQKIKNDCKLLLYKSMYLSALDRHEENIQLYQNYLPLLKKDSQEYFNFNMIILSSYRSLNNFNKCMEIHQELHSKQKLLSNYNYGIFMRLTNVYLPDDKAVRYAYRSVHSFHCIKNHVQEAKSMITYAKLLSGLGKGHKAIKIIKKAESLLNGIYVGKHMLYSNMAAFLLMQGDKGEDIWQLLNKAECSAVVPYDKLGIIVNKLVWCYENKRYDMLNLFISQINSLIPLEPDEHVHILLYYNLYLIYKQMGQEKNAKKYYDLSYKNRDKCKFVLARFENIKNKEMRYRLKYPWHICFLSYWTYDLDIDEIYGK